MIITIDRRDPADAGEELILADEVDEGDEGTCAIDGCTDPATVVIGPNGEMEICAGHAAELLRQLMALPMVRERLLAAGCTVWHFSREELSSLHALIRTGHPPDSYTADRRREWLELAEVDVVRMITGTGLKSPAN